MAAEENNSINEILEKAFRLALNNEHEYVTLEHLTLILLENIVPFGAIENSLFFNFLLNFSNNSPLIILKLLHPFMPFITEEIFQKLWGSGEYLMISKWPRFEAKYLADEEINE